MEPTFARERAVRLKTEEDISGQAWAQACSSADATFQKQRTEGETEHAMVTYYDTLEMLMMDEDDTAKLQPRSAIRTPRKKPEGKRSGDLESVTVRRLNRLQRRAVQLRSRDCKDARENQIRQARSLSRTVPQLAEEAVIWDAEALQQLVQEQQQAERQRNLESWKERMDGPQAFPQLCKWIKQQIDPEAHEGALAAHGA